MNCLKCGKELPDVVKAGRNPSYCSVGCRRAAEFEIRRINTRLASLEDELIGYKKWTFGRDVNGRTGPELVALQRSIIAEVEARLQLLLSANAEI